MGAGHAHLEVLRALSKEEVSANQFVLISPERQTYYSGLIPSMIAGNLETKDLRINSADFAEAKGFQFIQDEIESYSLTERTVTLASGLKEKFDLLSLNIGGAVRRLPTLAPLNTVYLKPFSAFVEQWPEVQRICSTNSHPRFVIVGGGAAAVEVAAALKVRLNRNQARKSEVRLVTQSSRLCAGYSPAISEALRKTVAKAGIQIHFNEPVSEVFDKHILLRSGERLNFDSIFLALPADSSPVVVGKSNDTLQVGPNIFAVGDCVSMENHLDLPRSGVVAVHQGRHLVESIRKILRDEVPQKFVPKEHFLNILVTGERSARMIWGLATIEGAIALKIKNWIDLRYMQSFK